jgi:hypothetical protein
LQQLLGAKLLAARVEVIVIVPTSRPGTVVVNRLRRADLVGPTASMTSVNT